MDATLWLPMWVQYVLLAVVAFELSLALVLLAVVSIRWVKGGRVVRFLADAYAIPLVALYVHYIGWIWPAEPGHTVLSIIPTCLYCVGLFGFVFALLHSLYDEHTCTMPGRTTTPNRKGEHPRGRAPGKDVAKALGTVFYGFLSTGWIIWICTVYYCVSMISQEEIFRLEREYDELESAFRGWKSDNLSDHFVNGLVGTRGLEGGHIVLDLGNDVKMELVRVAAGEFMMGSKLSAEELAKEFGGRSASYRDEHPQHKVRITMPFYMGVKEVTNSQYPQFTGESVTAEVRQRDAEYPVVGVDQADAYGFCRWLSRKTDWRVRLPTEAEWEYACRAGTDSVFSFGDDVTGLPGYGNFGGRAADDGYAQTAPTGSFEPNPWGLYDMHGNVAEWCSDNYHGMYYEISPVEDPEGPAGSHAIVVRGGSWLDGPASLRSAKRQGTGREGEAIGFRVVVEAAGEPAELTTYQVVKADFNRAVSPFGVYVDVSASRSGGGNRWLRIVVQEGENGDLRKRSRGRREIAPDSYTWQVRDAAGNVTHDWLARFVQDRDGIYRTVVCIPTADLKRSHLLLYFEDVDSNGVDDDVVFDVDLSGLDWDMGASGAAENTAATE